MLKNRADGELGTSVKERNEAEAAFFSKGSYAELDRSVVGIETLRDRLSHTLNEHLKKELPGLKRELDKKLEDTSHQLALLGSSRATIAEQKQYLTEIGMRAHDIFKSAVHGHYEQSFFHGMDTDERIDAGQNIRRLRSVIQYLNLEFAKRMRLSSRKYIITDDKGKEIEEDENEGSFPMEVDKSDLESAIDVKLQAPVHVPKKLTRKEAVVWVMRVLRRSRGRELPGNFNPMLISQLFWEQSTPWEAVSVQHIETVADICRQFVGDVIKSIASKDIEVRLQSARVESALDEALKSAKVELKKIIDDKQRHPITYNHYYTMTIQKMRRKKHNKVVKKMADDSKRQVSDQHRNVMTMIDPATLENLIDNHVELDMDKFSAEEALDSVSAYYKNKLKYFIDVVTEQVIERHLIDPLANTILSPIVIAGLTDEEVSYIAAEPSDVTQKRNFLEVRKKMLEDGQDTFRRAMGGLR